MDYDLFWDLRQQGEIQSARSAARRSEDKAENAVDLARRLDDRIDRLALINMALWSLLKERTGLTEEDLASRVQQLDLEDGRADGKIGGQVVECPQCRRTLSQKHQRCLYCGFEPTDREVFRSVARCGEGLPGYSRSYVFPGTAFTGLAVGRPLQGGTPASLVAECRSRAG